VSEDRANHLEDVIPAKAGIHFAVGLPYFPRKTNVKIKMDPGFRRDDDRFQVV